MCSSGCVEKRTCSRATSLGLRSSHGISLLSARQFVSSRQRMPGSQAMPPSISSTFRVGNRSNVPWQSSETRCDMIEQAEPSVCHSM